ncbi:MAG: hypothetical protein ACI94Y_002251, partial [Maribacter sp.]
WYAFLAEVRLSFTNIDKPLDILHLYWSDRYELLFLSSGIKYRLYLSLEITPFPSSDISYSDSLIHP